MDKMNSAQAEQLLKVAAYNVRALSKENQELVSERDGLKEKVASYALRERCEKIATIMEEKGLHSDLSREEKVADLLNGRNLDAVEEALKMGTPQVKVASVDEDSQAGGVPGSEDINGDVAAANFVAALSE